MKTKFFYILCTVLLISVSCNNEKELDLSSDKNTSLPISKLYDYHDLMYYMDIYTGVVPDPQKRTLIAMVSEEAYSTGFYIASGSDYIYPDSELRKTYAEGYAVAASVFARKILYVDNSSNGYSIMDLDERNPVNMGYYNYNFNYSDYERTAMAGVNHNIVISAMFRNYPDLLEMDDSDIYRVMNEVYDELVLEGLLQTNFITMIEEWDYHAWFLENTKSLAEEILRGDIRPIQPNTDIMEVYHRNVVLSPDYIEYSNIVIELIMNSYIDEELKESLIGSISVYINSVFLWRTLCPDPENSYDYVILYLDSIQNNEWLVLKGEDSKIKLYAMLGSGQFNINYLFGIPVYNEEGKIIRIVFYEDFLDEFGYVDHTTYNRYLRGGSFFTFENEFIVNPEQQHYPLYQLLDYDINGNYAYMIVFEEMN